MPDYKLGKIYKIVNEENDNIYIGSTVQQLCDRMSSHRKNYRIGGPTRRLFQQFDKVGLEYFNIVLLENYPCKTKEEFFSREDYWIKELKATLNMKKAVLTPKAVL